MKPFLCFQIALNMFMAIVNARWLLTAKYPRKSIEFDVGADVFGLMMALVTGLWAAYLFGALQ